jgi:hypothetical protein
MTQSSALKVSLEDFNKLENVGSCEQSCVQSCGAGSQQAQYLQVRVFSEL